MARSEEGPSSGPHTALGGDLHARLIAAFTAALKERDDTTVSEQELNEVVQAVISAAAHGLEWVLRQPHCPAAVLTRLREHAVVGAVWLASRTNRLSDAPPDAAGHRLWRALEPTGPQPFDDRLRTLLVLMDHLWTCPDCARDAHDDADVSYRRPH